MRTTLTVLALALAGIAPPGCIIVHTEEEVVYTPTDSTSSEIDAVRKLHMESSRLEAYVRIAQRPGLSDAAQVDLVNQALKYLSFESSKLRVLETLLDNPSLRPAGEAAMLERLDRLQFESSRARILEAISQRRARSVQLGSQ